MSDKKPENRYHLKHVKFLDLEENTFPPSIKDTLQVYFEENVKFRIKTENSAGDVHEYSVLLNFNQMAMFCETVLPWIMNPEPRLIYNLTSDVETAIEVGIDQYAYYIKFKNKYIKDATYPSVTLSHSSIKFYFGLNNEYSVTYEDGSEMNLNDYSLYAFSYWLKTLDKMYKDYLSRYLLK